MSPRLSQQQLRELIVESRVRLPGHPAKRHGFGRPTGLYVAAVVLYLALIAVMAASFLSLELAMPMVAFAGFVIAAFGLAARWMKRQPARESASPARAALRAQGIEL